MRKISKTISMVTFISTYNMVYPVRHDHPIYLSITLIGPYLWRSSIKCQSFQNYLLIPPTSYYYCYYEYYRKLTKTHKNKFKIQSQLLPFLYVAANNVHFNLSVKYHINHAAKENI